MSPSVAQQKLGTGEAQDPLEARTILGQNGEPEAIALPFAMADAAIAGVDHPARRIHEGVAIGLPFPRFDHRGSVARHGGKSRHHGHRKGKKQSH
jgi:hypothetical protein